MKSNYTAIIEKERGWYVAHCVEIPGASGRGPTEKAAQRSLAEAIALMIMGEAAQDLGTRGDPKPPRQTTH